MLLDGIVLVILGLSFISGYKKGLVYMLFFFIGLVVGTFAALNFSSVTARYISEWINVSEAWLPMLSLVVTFLLAFGAVRFIAQVLEGMLKFIQLNFINKLIGGAIGAALACICLSLFVWYAGGLNFIPQNLQTSSTAYSAIEGFTPILLANLQAIFPFFSDMLSNFEELFNQFNPLQETTSESNS